MKLNLEVETEALRENMVAFSAMTRKTARQSVKEISIMLLQAGYSKKYGVLQAKVSRRKIVRAVRRYRHGVEELAIDARPEAPGDKALYLIARPRNRRPIGKSAGRKWWTFESMEAARAHQPVTYRGVVRAGFWAQLPALGKAVPASLSKKSFLAAVPGLKYTQVDLDADVPSITITNQSVAIGFEKSDYWKKQIMMGVTNRIAGMARANEERLAAFKAAGGVRFNESSGTYEPLED